MAGTLLGTTLSQRLTSRREARAAALETAEAVASLAQYIWAREGASAAAMLGALRCIEVRLRGTRVHTALRESFAMATYTCWHQAATTPQGEPRITQEMLRVRALLEEALLGEILGDRGPVRRWRARRDALTAADKVTLTALPDDIRLLAQ